jgi:hypothetical protein
MTLAAITHGTNADGPDMMDDVMEMNELSQMIVGEPIGVALAPSNSMRDQNGRPIQDARIVACDLDAAHTWTDHLYGGTTGLCGVRAPRDCCEPRECVQDIGVPNTKVPLAQGGGGRQARPTMEVPAAPRR